MLELRRRVPLNKYPNIRPACLPAEGATYQGEAIVSGWGTVGYGMYANSWLHKANVTIYQDGDCGSMNEYMTDDMMCAGVKAGGRGSFPSQSLIFGILL